MTSSDIVSNVRHYAENVILELQILIDESFEEGAESKEIVTKFKRLSQKISQEAQRAVSLTEKF